MVKVGIVGGTGYTGVELLRLLANHPQARVEVITSRSEEGIPVADMYPNLRGHHDITFTVPDVDRLAACDVVFFATPHGVAMSMAPELVERGVRVIDLGADFRIKDIELWEKWYNLKHTCPDLVAKAVYGLPELNRDQIKGAELIGCAGCYPTAVQLGYLPLLESKLVDHRRLIADCKSGASGAGRGASVGTLLCEASESVKAYGVPGHRHLPEIRQGLSGIAERPVGLTFSPHLMPMIRGIHATLYSVLKDPVGPDLQALFEERYRNEPFVDVMPAGSHPETRSVKGSNMCRISVHQPQGEDVVVVLSVIDNLVKGASGQAVQIMNLMFDLPERSGLEQVALMP
ncbi:MULTISPECIES: N-acetyl-gamma-glutamyl-phosphate reductase [Marinobacterium]|uniref:N-acetyl-gamma-glutamyl-phosphate reductase n=2 Tax=Gammaproteobacteria TaxID=1236 RepID=A0A1H4GIU5_9GAMM|nr:N-acetyl-gamma-glutamyl-phosphate reductase [Marinobacterium iners]QSR36584.1 N-acetyl-gamma-glutamyl-phosphate reductase [Marinobacterium iners]SEB09535.1 N-acetyl-gamma-glutamyl-phosphate reductase [Marinobacterium iners DSM 11526]